MVQFKCPTCSGFVDYELLSEEVSAYRRYGVPQYRRLTSCGTCSAEVELECQDPPPRIVEP